MHTTPIEASEEQLETGLRGVPVGYCTTSSVDPQQGLFYTGRPVSELADWDPEDVIYLLFHGKEGSQEEREAFRLELCQRSQCAPKLIQQIQFLPREGHPMKLWSTAFLLSSMLEGLDDYREDALNCIASLPQIAASLINYHAGWGPTPESKPELGYMENFVHMLKVPGINSEEAKQQLTQVMRVFNILHYDHGGGNLSTFVGKAIASGLEDLYGSLAGAMNALAGPRHGKANQDCLNFVQEVLREVGPEAQAEDVEKLVRKRLENKELVFGFGHAVLRVEDPRATIFYEMAENMYPEHPLVKIALLLRTEGTKVLSENPKISNPYPNVDAMSGTLLTAAGFPFPEYYTVLFGLSRAIGIARQIVYERTEARGGKGTPIIRPKYLYKEMNES